MNLFDINGRTVVITGACGIIGSASAKYFASQGANVVLLAREHSRQKAEAIVSEIKEQGGEACFLASDVMNTEVLEKNYSEIMDRYGRIDVLLNAAGGNMPAATVPPQNTIFDLDINAVETVSDLNLFYNVHGIFIIYPVIVCRFGIIQCFLARSEQTRIPT